MNSFFRWKEVPSPDVFLSTNVRVWLVDASALTFFFVCPLGARFLVKALLWHLSPFLCFWVPSVAAEDKEYANLNSRSFEDELREILELSTLLVWYRWLAAILFAAFWLIIASCIWSAEACSSCSGTCRRRNYLGGQQAFGRASSSVEPRCRSRNSLGQCCRV